MPGAWPLALLLLLPSACCPPPRAQGRSAGTWGARVPPPGGGAGHRLTAAHTRARRPPGQTVASQVLPNLPAARRTWGAGGAPPSREAVGVRFLF